MTAPMATGAPHNSPERQTVAVFVSRGGLGDCAQHAAAYALQDGYRVLVIARTHDAIGYIEDKPFFTDAQRSDARLQPHVIDFASPEGTEGAAAVHAELAELLRGVSAVIAAPVDRQGMAAGGAASMRTIIAAVREARVPRLVFLSSVGVESRPMPWTWVGTVFQLFWLTVLRGTKRDLRAANAAVKGSGTDFLVVRPMGLDPGLTHKPHHSWKTLPAEDQKGPLAHNISKADVGEFMLKEALQPTLHGGDVQIGWELPAPPDRADSKEAKALAKQQAKKGKSTR